MKAFFVTGTDTGVGKTTVACALLAAARARGLRALGMKPVETGCNAGPDGIPLALDALALERAAREDIRETAADRAPAAAAGTSGQRTSGPAVHYNIYRFAAPLAPSVAAELEGAEVALAPILRGVDRLRSLAPDLLLVEGAGGLLVPLNASIDMADLAAALALPLIVVARDGLGTINHTLLTLEAARARGLEVAAVILSGATPGTSDRDAARNADEIARRGRVRVAGRLAYLAARSRAIASRTDPTPADSARARSTHEDSRANAARADPTRTSSPRADSTHASSDQADATPASAAPADSTRTSSPPNSTLTSSDQADATHDDAPPTSSTRTDSAPASAAPADSTRTSSPPINSTPTSSDQADATHDDAPPTSSTRADSAPASAARASAARADSTPTSSTRMDSTPASSDRADSAHDDAPPTSSTRADSAPASAARADPTRTSSTRADSTPASSDRADSARADAPPTSSPSQAAPTRAQSSLAELTDPALAQPADSSAAELAAPSLAKPAEPSLAELAADSSVAELAAPSLAKLAEPSLAELAEAAEAHLDLSILLPVRGM